MTMIFVYSFRPISCPYCTQNLPETNAVFTLKPKWVHASDVGKKTGLPKPRESIHIINS